MSGKGIQSLIPPQNRGEGEAINKEEERKEPEPKRPYHPQPDPSIGKGKDFVFQLELEKIISNPFQPRKYFSDEEINGLADSIREYGVLQPIVVTKVIKDRDYGTEIEYQLLAGERRLLAAKKAGLERIPAIVRKTSSGRESLEMALIENIQRSNLTPIESAKAYARLQDEFGLTQREIAARVGKSRETVANTVRLLNLPTDIQDRLAEGRISESQGRMLLSISDRTEQMRAFDKILSGRKTRRTPYSRKEKPVSDPKGSFLEKRLEEAIGSPVKVISYGDKGKIIIEFHSEEEKKELLERLLGEGGDVL